MYESYAIGPFNGGLNLRDFPDQLDQSQAYDLKNVTFTDRGGVKSRPGFENFKTGLTNRPDNIEGFSIGADWYFAVSAPGANNRLEVYNAAGTAVGTTLSSGITASPNYFARFRGGTSAGAKPIIYAANGTDELREWDGSAVTPSWSTPTWTRTNSAPLPKGMFVAVTPWDSRLVNARYPDTAGGQNPSTVAFSGTADPRSWDGFEYVDLTPGDGERIMGMVQYGNYIIVFKESKFFTFYGTTYNASNDLGVPEFEFRTVDVGIGLNAPQALCVAPDGVYFLSSNGIYKTDGGPPVLVSALIEPLFTGDLPGFYGGAAINFSAIDKARLMFHQQQVYVAVPTGSSSENNTMLVFDPRYGWWSVWDLAASAMYSFPFTKANPRILFSKASGGKDLGKVDAGLSADAGTGFQSWIKFGFSDLGVPIAKTLRETQVWGVGKIRFATARDLGGSSNAEVLDWGVAADRWGDGTGSDTWGDGTGTDTWSAGQPADFRLARRSLRGQVFGIEVYSNADALPGPWAFYKAIYRIRETRIASTTKVDKK